MNKNLTFSGSDTLAFIVLPNTSPIVLGSITTISYSSYRIKRPVNTLGGILIKGIAKGGRVVAGTLIFTLINQHWVNELLDMVPWLKENANDVIYSDELPLFDIMIVSANEYGNYVSMMIYGVDLTDEAQVLSVNDVYTENTFSFIAREIKPFSNKSENFKNGLYHSNKFFSTTKAEINLDWEYGNNSPSNVDKDTDYDREFDIIIKDKLDELGYETNITPNWKNNINEYVYDIMSKMDINYDIDISWFIEEVLPNIDKNFVNDIKYTASDNILCYSSPNFSTGDVTGVIYKNERIIIFNKEIFNGIEYYSTLNGYIKVDDVQAVHDEPGYINDVYLGDISIKDKVTSEEVYTTDLKLSEFIDTLKIKFYPNEPLPKNILNSDINEEYITNVSFTNKKSTNSNTIKKFTYTGDTQIIDFKDRKNILFESIDILEPIEIVIASNSINDNVYFKVYFTRGVVD